MLATCLVDRYSGISFFKDLSDLAFRKLRVLMSTPGVNPAEKFYLQAVVLSGELAA
jgi:hypothetical protein